MHALGQTWTTYSYYSSDSYTCEGHDEDSPVLGNVPMLEWIERQYPTGQGGDMTNMEFYYATDPTKFESVDYIYEHFDWEHC